jgi:hypothetical protein
MCSDGFSNLRGRSQNRFPDAVNSFFALIIAAGIRLFYTAGGPVCGGLYDTFRHYISRHYLLYHTGKVLHTGFKNTY